MEISGLNNEMSLGFVSIPSIFFSIQLVMKLTPSEKYVLGFLVFPEPFEMVLEESGVQYGTLRDDLINLINHGYVEVYLKDGSKSVSPFYDADNLEQFAFKATNSGLKAINSYAV